ncbi:MAG: undecaprenyl-diphosphate phosphatase [Bacteroidales bacterium]|jgi:undecaprenyl-diphosphatase|nr:undecaprenyl-diphosphate phosphatase [Bacteroidales bacterium]
MSVIEAIILGIIQGLTEFLPVSSSGHLAIANDLLGMKSGEDNLLMTVVLHAATALSTICVLRKQIWNLLKGLFAFQWNEETQYIVKLCISMLPVMVIGLFFKSYVEEVFGSGLLIVGICLLLTAILLFFAHRAKVRQQQNITYKDAFVIGLAQMAAVLPGLSRSGATIATGLLLGKNKASVAHFSFLMVLVPILGEAFLDSIKIVSQPVSSIPLISMLAGFCTAFLTGFLACKWMLALVAKGKLLGFSIYCALLAVIVLIFCLI